MIKRSLILSLILIPIALSNTSAGIGENEDRRPDAWAAQKRVHTYVAPKAKPAANRAERKAIRHERTASATIIPHPDGCPRVAFCACGAAVKIFGSAVRKLWPSSAWLAMPRAEPGHLKVAARQGHVFVIDYMIDSRTAMAWDYNSGGHQSRYHARSIAGYKIVQPSLKYAEAF